MRETCIAAEQAGKHAFNAKLISSNKEAERLARRAYNSTLAADCFVAGWNMAYWDEQSRVLKGNK